MANVNNPRGAQIAGCLDGGDPTQRLYQTDASATRIFKGDFVKMEADGYIAVAAAGNRLLGVSLQDSTASTAEDLLVCDDPRAIFVLQDDGDTGQLAILDRGMNVDIIATTGNTTTGRSKHEIDSDSQQTTSRQLRLYDIDNKPGNAIGANCEWQVVINEHEYQIGGTGV